MSYKERLLGNINKSHANIDSQVQRLFQVRQKLIEIRVKADKDEIKRREFHQILDEIVNSLSPKAGQEIQKIIEDLYALR